MQVTLYHNESAPRTLDKKLTTKATLQGQVLDDLEEVNPVIRFRRTDFSGINYARIRDRYYFLKDLKFKNQGICEVTFELDVLTTYKDQILNATAYIDQATTGYSALVESPNVVLQANSEYTVEANTISSLDSKQAGGMYILVVNKRGY